MSQFTDYLKDSLVEKLMAVGISLETSRMVAVEYVAGVQQDFKGESPYIGGREIERSMMSERNRAIIRDHKAGERVALLQRRYGISRRRLYEIING